VVALTAVRAKLALYIPDVDDPNVTVLGIARDWSAAPNLEPDYGTLNLELESFA
jgi:hypothetical protein